MGKNCEALGGKRERVSLGTDDRARVAAVSEPVLGKLWNSMTEMKQAMPETVEMSVMHASLGSSQFPCEWGSLLLQIEEAPGRGRLSRLDAASFLVNGWLASENINSFFLLVHSLQNYSRFFFLL